MSGQSVARLLERARRGGAGGLPGALVSRILTRIRPLTARGWRRAVVLRARERTGFLAPGPLLVLAPHPDDETLGCGALIARRLAGGDRVVVAVVTDGRYSHTSSLLTPDDIARLRATEVLRATAELGVPAEDLVTLGYAENSLADHIEEVADRIAALIDEYTCQGVVVTCSLDWHIDHQSLAASARLAVARAEASPELAEYPVWTWAEGPGPRFGPARAQLRAMRRGITLLRPGAAVRVPTGMFVEAKRRALREHRSQTVNLTGEPEWAVMTEDFLEQFLGSDEIFFPVSDGGTSG